MPPYVDGTNTYLEAEGDKMVPECDEDGGISDLIFGSNEEVNHLLQENAQMWTNLVARTGGLMALHKCC